MPSPGLAAGSFFLGGQLQGQQQAQLLAQQQAIQQQIALAKLGLEQRRAASAGKRLIQQPDGSYTVVDLQTATPGSTIGTTVDYGARLRDMVTRGALPESLKGLAQGAIASGDRGYQEQVFDTAMKLAGSPSYYKANLSPAEQQQAIAEALPYAPREIRGLLQRAAQPGADPALIDLAYKKVLPPAFGSGMYSMRYFPVTSTDPSGATVTTPYAAPARGGPASPVIAGGGGAIAPMNDPAATGGTDSSGGTPVGVGAPPGFGGGGIGSASSAGTIPGQPLKSVKISPTEQKLVAQLQNLIPQLKDRLRELEAIGPDKWNRGSAAERYIDYRKQKNLKVAPSDPALANLLPKMISVEASANAALAASSGTRAYGYMQKSEGHIPSAYGDYNYNIQTIKGLLDPNGPYLPTLRELGLKPAEAAPESSGGSGIPSDLKPIAGGKYLYSPSTGKYYAP